jgi:S1-C subfamily serine protease
VEGLDLNKDLIVFQLYDKGSTSKPQSLPHVTLGSSQESNVGDRVIVIGSPQGLENTMSDGILSAVREYETTRLLQITAPISPGSSGGPVFNAAGKVIGIASFQFAKGQNLNFAIAAEHVQPLLEQHFGVALSRFESFGKHEERVHSDATESETTEVPRETGKNVERPLTGQFAGVVHNVTSNVSAEFGIIVSESGGVLSGCMGVRQPLFGSGPLSGVVTDSSVSFVVTSAIGAISFEGQRSGSSVSGTYTVTHDAAPNEEGTFTLRKSKSQSLPSDFDSSTCPTDAEMNQ